MRATPAVVFASLMSAGTMASATLTSTAFELRHCTMFSVQAIFTGSPVGTLKLQVSCDNSGWSDLASSSQSITTAGDVLWTQTDAAYGFVRLVYTKTSGSGSLSVTACAKAP